ncbi:hypothetical protein P9112_010675 [Eukaryota sp. TZLM1-RC]
MANPELPRRGRVLPWEVYRPECKNTACKTTVAAATVLLHTNCQRLRPSFCSLLFTDTSEHGPLCHQLFWYQCQDFVMMTSPPVRSPFENNREVYEALSYASDPTRLPFSFLGCDERTDNWCHSDIRSFRALQMANSFCHKKTNGPVEWKLNFYKTMAALFDQLRKDILLPFLKIPPFLSSYWVGMSNIMFP